MVGRDDHKVVELPHERLREVLKKYNRLAKPAAPPPPKEAMS